MSQVSKYVFDHYLILMVICMVVAVTIFFSINIHDSLIDSEKILNEIYSMDTCKGMIWDKNWEEKKIWKDDLRLRIISKYMIEKRC